VADTAIQRVSDTTLWTATDVALVRGQYAKGTDDAEWRQFVYLANKYELDPMIRQIWCIKYGKQAAQIFAGRDGFLAIAHRSGQFDGMNSQVRIEQVPFSVEYKAWENGQPVKGVYKREYQYVATVTVYHKQMAHPVVVEVWEGEYSTGQNLWLTKPRTMIVKVGESQALRRAFNISGLYDPAEMGNKGETAEGDTIDGEAREVSPQPAAAPDVAMRAARKRFKDQATEAGYADLAGRQAWVAAQVGHSDFDTLTVADWERLAGQVLTEFMDGPTRTWDQPAMADAAQGETP
jgi:phage recombination protein Bet